MPKNSYERHDGTPTLRRLTKLLSGALDDSARADPDRRRKQVFDAFFDVVKSDETYAREMCRFWFEQAYGPEEAGSVEEVIRQSRRSGAQLFTPLFTPMLSLASANFD